MSAFKDLSKVGILLIGVALLIVAAIAIHWYLTFLIHHFSRPYEPPPLHAHCSDKAIIIHAERELLDVKVLDNRSNLLCSFERIVKGSEELCMVDSFGVYVVQVEDFKDIVICERKHPPTHVYID